MKRIIFILPSLTLGGLERAQVTLANALVSRGYDVTVTVLENRLDLKDELDERVHLIYKPYKPHKIMRRIPYIRHKFYDDGMWETRATPEKLYEYYIGDESYDVEIAYFRGLPVKIISGSKNRNSKKLSWVHSDFEKCGGITNNFKSLNDAKAAYSVFDRIICVSQKVKESFEKVIGFKNKTITINNIIPTEAIKEKAAEKADSKSGKFTMISIGHLIPVKGYDRLLKVALRLKANGYDFELWIIGDGADKESLEAFKRKNNMDYVRFLGIQENPYKFLTRADLYVCSSLYEGYPTTVCESIVCGTPVLSTLCAGSNEILDNGKYGIVTENSEEGLYKGLESVLSDKEMILLNKFKSILNERINYFDKDNILDKVTALF